MSDKPILHVANIEKHYTRGYFNKERTFSLQADFTYTKPEIVCVMGANGAGKTTLFEMITGTTPPTSGRVLCAGQDIHNIKYDERDRLAIHYHQSYQVRHIHWTKPAFMMESANSTYPIIHLFDEPQFNTQDGYIHFILDFFQRLRSEGRLVFISIHPTETYQLHIVKKLCDSYMFVAGGRTTRYPSWDVFFGEPIVHEYLGKVAIEFQQESNYIKYS